MNNCLKCEFYEGCTGLEEDCIYKLVSVGNFKDKVNRKNKKKKMKKDE